MTSAELNQAFAREVAGLDPDQDCLYENGREIIDHGGIPACVCGWMGRNWDQTDHKKVLPDYTKDWNAVIAEIEKRGLNWEKRPIEGHDCFLVSHFHFLLSGIPVCSTHVWIQPADCEGLARAVLDCVRAMTIEKRKYNDRENPE